MPNSLEQRLKDKELEVLEVVRSQGIKKAMSLYGIRTRNTFTWWLKMHSNGNSLYPNPLAGFSGGEKANWLRKHRNTILDCLEIFGEDFAMEHFCLKEETLHQLKSAGEKPFGQKLTKLGTVELKANSALDIAEQAQRKTELLEARLETHQARQEEIIKRQKQLEKLFYQFEARVSRRAGTLVIAPFVERLIQEYLQSCDNLPEQFDPLSLESLCVDGKKSQLEYGAIKSTPDNPLLETIVKFKLLKRGNSQNKEADSESKDKELG